MRSSYPTGSLMEELIQRQLLAQSTDASGLRAALESASMRFYCGFDPTADSLHVGHLLLLMLFIRFQRAGHAPYLILGGATGLIGDPSFNAQERVLSQVERIENAVQGLQTQLSQYLDFSGPYKATLLNNAAWAQSLNLIHFLRDIGKHFSINAMIQREAIQQRLLRIESGISFTEFSYMLLQAYDYLWLHENHGVNLQIGGSDQWGNIVAGIKLIHARSKAMVHGITVPLITRSDGQKFGKTAQGTVWLDKNKTSPYQFYQFWFATPDDKVWSYLHQLTLLLFQEIEEIRLSFGPPNRGQALLARWLTEFIHGPVALQEILALNQALFEGNLRNLSLQNFQQFMGIGFPSMTVESDGYLLTDALVTTGLCGSRSEAKRQLHARAITVNDSYCPEQDILLNARKNVLAQGCTVLRRGRKHYAIVRWEKGAPGL